MSGVGVSGLIANLPSTITPYPTQDPALELGGYRSVANATARDAIPANFRSIGMEVTLQDTGASYELFGGITNADWKLRDAPLRGQFFVDPTYTGPQLGSSSNPFTTIAAAFAAGAALALTAGIITIAPTSNCVENVTFPTTGEWEICGPLCIGALTGVQITGNVDLSATAARRATVRGIRINGNVTGTATGVVQRILWMSSSVTGTVTLLTASGGTQRLAFGCWSGEAFSGIGVGACSFSAAVAVQGTVTGTGAIFGVSLSFTQTSALYNCLLPPNTIFAGTSGGALLYLFDCANALGGALTFTSNSGGFLQLQPDDVTNEELMRVSCPTVGDVRLFSNIGRGFTGPQVTNVGVTPIAGVMPKGLMVMECCLTLLANAGATAGNAVLNAVYTDMTGTLVTEQVTTAALNVAGAIGSKVRGVLPISQNGASAVSFSVTGITDATSLSYQCDVRLRQAS